MICQRVHEVAFANRENITIAQQFIHYTYMLKFGYLIIPIKAWQWLPRDFLLGAGLDHFGHPDSLTKDFIWPREEQKNQILSNGLRARSDITFFQALSGSHDLLCNSLIFICTYIHDFGRFMSEQRLKKVPYTQSFVWYMNGLKNWASET